VLSTDQKGSIAETAIIHEAVKLGIDVYKPISDGTRCDLILDIDGSLTRVQCKWAARHGDVLVIRCYRCRRTRSGLLKRGYTADEVDAFAAYCVELGKCYFFRFEDWGGRTAIQLRLRPSKNNQRRGINWAEEYEFGATLAGEQGAVAQLGERQRGTLEATGSSPVGST
jgi:PD-(D/E)XK endonuclease